MNTLVIFAATLTCHLLWHKNSDSEKDMWAQYKLVLSENLVRNRGAGVGWGSWKYNTGHCVDIEGKNHVLYFDPSLFYLCTLHIWANWKSD